MTPTDSITDASNAKSAGLTSKPNRHAKLQFIAVVTAEDDVSTTSQPLGSRRGPRAKPQCQVADANDSINSVLATFKVEQLQQDMITAARFAQSKLHSQGIGFVHACNGQVIETLPDGSERVLHNSPKG